MRSMNRLIIAAAGSGKTTYLVKEALALTGKRIALLTYTNSNSDEIRKKLIECNGAIPSRFDVLTWFRFLLHECARPYQRSVYPDRRIGTIHYTDGKSALYVPHKDTARYYFANKDEVYADKIAQFVIDCNHRTNGLVTARLKAIYDCVFIDEFQDLAGYDLDVVQELLESGVGVVMVGDPRQTIYDTNPSRKNKQFRKTGILKLAKKWESTGLCRLETQAWSHRCNQAICDNADRLWPIMEKTVSYNSRDTGHDGVFVVRKADLHRYMQTYQPHVLRYDKRTSLPGYPATNFGIAKGRTFDRVLILPHGPIKKYLSSDDLTDISGSLEKFYVALTRARYSVALLHDGEVNSRYDIWPPGADS